MYCNANATGHINLIYNILQLLDLHTNTNTNTNTNTKTNTNTVYAE